MPADTVPPRPTASAPCSCIWLKLAHLQAEQEREDSEKQQYDDAHPKRSMMEQAREAIPNPLNALPAAFSKKKDEIALAAEGAGSEIANTKGVAVQATKAPFVLEEDPSFKMEKPADVDARVALKSKVLKKRGALTGLNHPDVLIRTIKKRLSKSSENKLGALLSYREDLVNTLTSLIPSSGKYNPRSRHPPVIKPVPNTTLCPTCAQNLTCAMYYSPAARTPYIREHSTAAYLALVDDAIAALGCGMPMEHITHPQLESILRVELSVVEWRITLKLARYHKRTGFLDMFPVRIGEFAEMEFNPNTPVQHDGLVKKAGKKLMRAVGLGDTELPSIKSGAIAAVDQM
ncbi:hypothetical protein DFJ77DRAFT_474248 [Powellomyces hirtus]|nr:hypothetical protein DFJ77DRAFT_474248 [Powellomyces hirtus]